MVEIVENSLRDLSQLELLYFLLIWQTFLSFSLETTIKINNFRIYEVFQN